jgi:hypothetical protein
MTRIDSSDPIGGVAGSVPGTAPPLSAVWGWDQGWADAFAPLGGGDLWPARVIAQHRGAWILTSEAGEISASLTGRFRHEAFDGDLPAVGDWVGYLNSPTTERRGSTRCCRGGRLLRRRAAGPRRRPDPRRQRGHALHRHLAERRPQPSPARAVRGDGPRLRRGAGRTADKGGPRRRCGRGDRSARVGVARRGCGLQLAREHRASRVSSGGSSPAGRSPWSGRPASASPRS